MSQCNDTDTRASIGNTSLCHETGETVAKRQFRPFHASGFTIESHLAALRAALVC